MGIILLGNGCTIDFLSDRWCGEKALQLAFPEVYDMAECKTVKAKDCLGSDGWNWNVILGGDGVGRQGLCSTWSEFKDQISACTGDQSPDMILWRWDPGGRFSVKSTYSALRDGGTRDARANKLWRL